MTPSLFAPSLRRARQENLFKIDRWLVKCSCFGTAKQYEALEEGDETTRSKRQQGCPFPAAR